MSRVYRGSVLSWLTIAAAVMATAGLLLLFGWDEYRNWQVQRGRAELALQQASDGLSRHFDGTIHLARIALWDVVSEFRDEIDHPQKGFKLRKMMLRQLAAAPQLEMVSAIDASGRLIAISANSPPGDVDFSKQDYFLHHRQSRDQSPYVALPQRSRLDGNWVLTVSQRLDDPKGNFAGVIVASFTMKYFDEFFRSYGLSKDAAFVIARADGIVLAQAPYDARVIGQDVSSEKRFPAHFQNSRDGVIYYTSSFDQLERVGAFKQSAQTGVIVLTTATISSIFSQWAQDELFRWLILVVVVGLSCAALLGWVVQSRRRLESEQKTAAREAEFRLLAEASVDMIQRLDLDGKRLYVSPAAQKLFGIDPSELIGQHFSDGLDEVNTRAVMAALARLRNGSEFEKVVVTRGLAEGRTAWVETTLRQVNDGAGTSIVAVSRDITAQKLQHNELEELARTDGLTGLLNRRAFDTAFTQLADEARWKRKPLSLLMIDVDCFKKYNDLYGHAAGDDCLKAIARAMQNTLRNRSDHIFRYGGEEFSVLLTTTELRRALACAERLRVAIERLGLPHANHEAGQLVTVSIGTATLQPGEEGFELLKRADAALYKAKNAGRNRVVADIVETTDRKTA
jgi:diguanylate cyclase (GGDEF)-like protein/PAS domain S-box-containing protein